MKSFAKLPLYLGVAVLVASILISVAKIGNQQAVTTQQSRANVAGASLILKYTAPNIASLLLTANKPVKGIDVNIKFNGDKISVLPSSLVPGPEFVTSGGNVGDKDSLFTFSAIAKKNNVSAGLVATFTVKPKVQPADADLQFNKNETKVLDNTGQNMAVETQGVKFSLSSQ